MIGLIKMGIWVLSYGHQWRNWNGDEIDQIKELINSKRIIQIVEECNGFCMEHLSIQIMLNLLQQCADGKAALATLSCFFSILCK